MQIDAVICGRLVLRTTPAMATPQGPVCEVRLLVVHRYPPGVQKLGHARVPSSGVIPPAPPPRRSRGGPLSSSDRLHGWRCKGWAGPFPWFEYHLNQTNHAQAPLCRT